jgi:hypothetical protein
MKRLYNKCQQHMKNKLIILLSLATLPLFAQTTILEQKGLVREQNSGKKPLPDVQIVFDNAVPAASDPNGKFTLHFQGKKAGDLIFYTDIVKKGYEIVNAKDLQVLKISSTQQLAKDIILTKAGNLDIAKKEYYGISDKALLTSFNKEKARLQDKLNNTQVSQQAYLIQYNALADQYEQQQHALDALAEVFARVNFDDVSAEYKKAFNLFKTGQIDASLKILESLDLISRAKNRLKEKKRLATAAQTIEQQRLQLQAQLYVLTFQIDKMEKLYDRVLLLDSTDLQILRGVSL